MISFHNPRLQPQELRLLAAENDVTIAWQRLNALRSAAFFGGQYDSDAYDRAVFAYREARQHMRDAQAAWSVWHTADHAA